MSEKNIHGEKFCSITILIAKYLGSHAMSHCAWLIYWFASSGLNFEKKMRRKRRGRTVTEQWRIPCENWKHWETKNFAIRVRSGKPIVVNGQICFLIVFVFFFYIHIFLLVFISRLHSCNGHYAPLAFLFKFACSGPKNGAFYCFRRYYFIHGWSTECYSGPFYAAAATK